MVLATIDFTERLKNGEQQSFPPVLTEQSKIDDYNEWLKREDMFLPDDADSIYVKLIGYTPDVTSAMVWIKHYTPSEVHNNEFEKFLIVEGTCDITVDEKIYSLVAGDYLSIPLYVSHHVKVTSKTPCKVILQRVAA
jgi:mannose-6-phosphate isomerase-like protein (cupin superfamily)